MHNPVQDLTRYATEVVYTTLNAHRGSSADKNVISKRTREDAAAILRGTVAEHCSDKNLFLISPEGIAHYSVCWRPLNDKSIGVLLGARSHPQTYARRLIRGWSKRNGGKASTSLTAYKEVLNGRLAKRQKVNRGNALQRSGG